MPPELHEVQELGTTLDLVGKHPGGQPPSITIVMPDERGLTARSGSSTVVSFIWFLHFVVGSFGMRRSGPAARGSPDAAVGDVVPGQLVNRAPGAVSPDGPHRAAVGHDHDVAAHLVQEQPADEFPRPPVDVVKGLATNWPGVNVLGRGRGGFQ